MSFQDARSIVLQGRNKYRNNVRVFKTKIITTSLFCNTLTLQHFNTLKLITIQAYLLIQTNGFLLFQ